MEMTISQEKENKFFKRKDVELSIRHLGVVTPSKKDVVKELAAKYGVDETQVQIGYIFTKKGIGESFVSTKILNEKPEKVEAPKPEKGGETVEAQASETA
ncbi:MAG: hypothetical protein HYW24_03070 [Candidatus Aenigmarchaeota archaeon]|nr:hypothetical protein [Candidatus Aenigmarchaeota archaeon]